MKSFAQLWWASLAIKLIITYFLPLSLDETYYWQWAFHLQLSYYDHPMMVGLWFWLGRLFGDFSPIIKFPAIMLGHLSLWIWDLYLRDKLNFRQRYFFWLLYLLTPLTGLGSLILTPDLPLMFFTALAVWWSDRLIKNPSSIHFMILGLILGLGFISKYHMVLLFPILIILLFYQGKLSLLWSWKMLLLIVTGLIASSPLLWWNYTHDWISIRFQLQHGFGANFYKLSTLLDYVAGQILLIHPIFIPFLFKHFRSIQDLHIKFWRNIVIFILIFFGYTSLKSHVEANWTTQLFPFLWAWIASQVSFKWIRSVLIFWVSLSALVISLWLQPWFSHPALIKLNEVHRLQPLIEQTKNLTPLYTSYHLLASSLSYYQQRQIYKLRGSNRFDYYDMLPNSLPSTDLFFFAAENEHKVPEQYLINYKVEVYQQIQNDFIIYKATKL